MRGFVIPKSAENKRLSQRRPCEFLAAVLQKRRSNRRNRKHLSSNAAKIQLGQTGAK